jgi:methionyl-tRNA formyltransferase
LLALARLGAFNLHGSLLPKYRGRVPINWAVLHGEQSTGATLHEMAAKPDAGAIVAQTSVPILPDDTAYEVFGKVVVAAEKTLWDVLPDMLAGRIPRLPNDISQGSYFGGRKPADGQIDWQQAAQQVYNLHRAVAPPYPGAWTVLNGVTYVIGKARLSARTFPDLAPGLAVVDNRVLGICGDARALAISALLVDGVPLTPAQLQQNMSGKPN